MFKLCIKTGLTCITGALHRLNLQPRREWDELCGHEAVSRSTTRSARSGEDIDPLIPYNVIWLDDESDPESKISTTRLAFHNIVVKWKLHFFVPGPWLRKYVWIATPSGCSIYMFTIQIFTIFRLMIINVIWQMTIFSCVCQSSGLDVSYQIII